VHAEQGCAAAATAAAAAAAAPPVPCALQAASEEEREHAELLMEYQNVRGGRVRLASMLQPETEFNHEDKVRHSMWMFALDSLVAISRLSLTTGPLG
jgi:hypothetical protein